MRGLHRIADAKVALQQALELEAGNAQYTRMLEQLQAMKEADFMPEPTDEDTGDMVSHVPAELPSPALYHMPWDHGRSVTYVVGVCTHRRTSSSCWRSGC